MLSRIWFISTCLFLILPLWAADAPANPTWKVTRIVPGQPAAVFQDGEAIKIDIVFDKPVIGSYKIVRVRRRAAFGTKNTSQIELVDLQTTETGRLPALNQSADGNPVWSLVPKVTLHGVYSVRITSTDGIEGQAITFALVPKHHPGWRADFFNMTNWGGTPGETYDEMAAMTQRIGFKWIREETGWRQAPPKDGKPGAYDWSYDDVYAKALRKYQLYALIGGGHAPNWAWPKDAEGKTIWYNPGSPSTVPGKDYLDGFEQWHTEYVKRYSDVVKMLDLFNEPWEGSGISGFGSTGGHLREMMRRAYRGSKIADPTFMVGGVDSHSENEDHLLCDPNFVNYTDFLAYHTFVRHATTGALQAQRYGKTAYDTESWVGCGVATPLSICNAMAMGMKMSHNYWQDALVSFRNQGLVMPAAPLSQAAAVNWFLTDMDYAGQPNARSLPCLFIFKERKDSPTQRNYHSLAYFAAKPFPWVGNNDFIPEQLTRDDQYKSLLLRGEDWDQIIPAGTFSIPDPKNELMVYDFDANPLPALRQKNSWILPIAINQDCYITCTSGHERLQELLKIAKIQGMPPAQIEFKDFTRRLESNPPLRVVVRNAYNVPISGTALVTGMPTGWQMETKQTFTNIPAGGRVAVEFPVQQAVTVPQNFYPFTVRVDTDRGASEWTEELRCNVIVKGTIIVDGKLDDWKAIRYVPQTIFGRDVPPDPILRYMKPYEEFTTINGADYHGQFATASDDKNFYCMMVLNDPKPDISVSMKKGKWYEMVPGSQETVYKMGPLSPMVSSPDMLQIAFDFERNLDDFLPPDDPMYRQWPFRETDYEYSLYPTKENDAECWRLYAPNTYYQCHVAPFSPNPYSAQGVVDTSQAVTVHDGKQWIFEWAIPWSEMPLLKRSLTPGRVIDFAYKMRRDGGDYYSTQMRSACKRNGPSWHPDYMWENWSVDTEWGFEE